MQRCASEVSLNNLLGRSHLRQRGTPTEVGKKHPKYTHLQKNSNFSAYLSCLCLQPRG